MAVQRQADSTACPALAFAGRAACPARTVVGSGAKVALALPPAVVKVKADDGEEDEEDKECRANVVRGYTVSACGCSHERSCAVRVRTRSVKGWIRREKQQLGSEQSVERQYIPSRPELPPFKMGTPPGLSSAIPRCSLSTLPTLLSLPAAIPGTSEKSTSMNRSIMSLVTCGTSKPAMCDAPYS